MSASEPRDHDPSTFDDVYGEYHARIRRYLDRLIGPGESEDVAQEVFTKVSRALPQFRNDSSLSTWIYRIATNAAYDRLRSRGSHPESDVSIDDGMPVANGTASVEQAMVRREMDDCIDRFIARLPPSYRSVLILSEYEGLANQEIADALGLTLHTAKIRLHRARARLRKELGSGCDFYRDERNEFACDPKPPRVSPED